MKRIHVVLAVIRGAGDRVLLSRRAADAHLGGLWEFPGGKVEAGETEPEALARELEEELGLRPLDCAPLATVSHDYPDRQVRLSAWEVRDWLGQPQGREGQPLSWVRCRDLPTMPFPAANGAIVSAAMLPDCWHITPALCTAAAAEDWARARLPAASDHGPDDGRPVAPAGRQPRAGWLLRQSGWSSAQLIEGACRLLALAGPDGPSLLLHGDPALLARVPGAAGVHLPAAVASRLLAATPGRPVGLRPGQLLSVAAHDAHELSLAMALQADCALLSPLRPTASHPGAEALGWSRWRRLVADAPLPVYALGGMHPADLDAVRAAGGRGVAGIGGF